MDILERLRRSVTRGHEPTDEDAIAAAEEIERLRAALKPFAEAFLLSQKYRREDREGYLANALTYAEFEKANDVLALNQQTPQEPDDKCVDCGSPGECAPGCPSRLLGERS